MTDTPEQQDSKALGAQRKTRFTDRLNVKCDPETKEAILTFSRQSGLSLCQIYDALTRAFLHGVKAQKDLGAQSPTINLTIERMVQRPRRYARETFVDEGVALVDFYDDEMTEWLRVSVDEYGVNPHGHGIGCACLICKPRRR